MAQLQWRTPRVGSLITAVGVVHVASTPVFFPESVRSIVDGRIFGTVSAEPSAMPVRAAGFWYAIAGIAVAAFGWMTGHVERNGGTLPRATPVVLAGLGVTGVALDPQSGLLAAGVDGPQTNPAALVAALAGRADAAPPGCSPSCSAIRWSGQVG